jgi:hypothetical protein
MNYTKFFFLVGVLFFIFSCKNDEKSKDISDQDTLGITDSSGKLNIGDPCSFITIDQISRIFDVDHNSIDIQSEKFKEDYSKSCSLSWRDQDSISFNMLLVLQSNPLVGEFDDWADYYVQSKITTGENTFPNNGKNTKYAKISEIDSTNAFNQATNKFYWKVDKNYVLTVYMNENFQKDKVKDYMIQLYNIMNKNARKSLKAE